MGNTESTLSRILVRSCAVDFGIQWLMFAVSFTLQSDLFFDITGCGTGTLLALQSLWWGGKFYLRQKIITGMVTVWGLRIGLYLFSRVLKTRRESRFNKVRNNCKIMFYYWNGYGVWIFMTVLPTLMLNAETRDVGFGTRDYIGWGVWIVGFLIETVADQQKSVFRAHPDNAKKFITNGLWSVCRHPNYFGEILLWSGIWLSASSVMRGWQHLSIISPIFVWFLINNVSGINIIKLQGQRRWGNDPKYLEYLQNVPVLIPFIGWK